MVPVFENRRVRSLQFVQHVRMIVRHTRPKHVMVRPLDHIDWVYLHISQVLDGFQDRRFSESKRRFVIRQALRSESNGPNFGW